MTRTTTDRTGTWYSLVPSMMVVVYVSCTWDDATRPVMLATAMFMLAGSLIGWLTADRLSGTRWWRPSQLLRVAANLAGATVLALLDGGVAGPLGALVPATVVLAAIMVPPRPFLAVATFGALGYGTLVTVGDPGPPGYWVVHALGFGCAAALCLRHTTVLGSLRSRLAHTSRTDPLTGCLNRRGFDERVAASLKNEPVSLVLLDLDHFKQVNDAYGHQAGDDLLTWAGHVLRREVREEDAVGRLGGDEFALLLPGTGPDEAAAVVHRVRTALRDSSPGSLGYATFPYDATTADALSGVADRRLYADKAARERRVPGPDAVAQARDGVRALDRVEAVSARERRRHSIADPGWMSITQTSVALVYVLFFAVGHPYRLGMLVICLWGFGAGAALIAAADWLSRSRHARPLLLSFAVSAFLSCAGIAALDGGVGSPLGIGMLLSVPLIMLGMRTRVAAPVAVAAGLLYVLVAVVVGGAGAWFVAINLFCTAVTALACAVSGRDAAEQRRRLTRLARSDVLTGVLNRRGFAQQFQAAATRTPAPEPVSVWWPGCGKAQVSPGRTSQTPTYNTGMRAPAPHTQAAPGPCLAPAPTPIQALVVFDLDGFKQVNDVHGHAAGDELLRWVAGTLSDGAGPEDLVGRLGGDEFVMLLHGDDPAGTAARLRQALAARIGASVGVAVLGTDGDDFDGLYAVADARLYSQKRSQKRGITVSAARTGLPNSQPWASSQP